MVEVFDIFLTHPSLLFFVTNVHLIYLVAGNGLQNDFSDFRSGFYTVRLDQRSRDLLMIRGLGSGLIMETRANYAIIGLFTLAVVLLGFVFVYWFSGRGAGEARSQVFVVFSGSVTGLSRGSNVLFNGLRVGEVVTISLLPEDPRRVISLIEVEPFVPLRADTRARLEYQGLTGVAQISLSGGEAAASALVPSNGQKLPVIFADRSDFQDLLETARTIARRTDDFLERMNRLVDSNEGAITRTLANIEKFSDALGNNADGINHFLAQIGKAAESIGPLAQRLETLSGDLQKLVQTIEPKDVNGIVKNVEALTAKLNHSADRIDGVLASVEGFLGSAAGGEGKSAFTQVGDAARAIRDLTANLEKRITEISGNLKRFTGSGLREVEAFASDGRKTLQSLDRAVRSLERNPQQVILGPRPTVPDYQGGR
jgi:phospholipid/cholesterol/gamma-HCH transport system substrate-binding protein